MKSKRCCYTWELSPKDAQDYLSIHIGMSDVLRAEITLGWFLSFFITLGYSPLLFLLESTSSYFDQYFSSVRLGGLVYDPYFYYQHPSKIYNVYYPSIVM